MQPPIDTTIRDLDLDMTSIIDKTEIDMSEKVRLYNQAVKSCKRARCASRCEAQRRNEGEHCRVVQSDSEDMRVALFHEKNSRFDTPTSCSLTTTHITIVALCYPTYHWTENMASEFYLVLPSKSSMITHPNNMLAQYITNTPLRISLSGDWECGLT